MPRVCVRILLLLLSAPRMVLGGEPWATPQELGLRHKCGVTVSEVDETPPPKKGAAFTTAMLKSGIGAGMAWHTNWRTDPSFAPAEYGEVKFVPQFWGRGVVPFGREG